MDLIKDLFKGDKVIWIIFLFLCLISIVEVFSAASTLTYKSGDHWGPITQHSVILMVGVCIVVLVHNIPYKYFRVFPVFLLPLSTLLLIFVMGMGLITGDRVNGAARWMTFFGIQFQPSELAKMAVIIVTAFILSKFQEEESESIQIYNVDHRSCFHSDCSRKRLYRSTAFRSSLFNDGDRPGTLEAIGQVNGNSRSYGGFFCRHSDDYAHTQTEQSPHDAPCRNLAEPYKRLL